MNKKISIKSWISFIIIGLAGQLAWAVENMYLNSFIFYLDDGGNYLSLISLTVALSAVTACLTTILIGALTDYLGKRKIFIISGYILWGISTAAFGLINVDNVHALFPIANAGFLSGVFVVVLDCVMTFFGSSANDASFNSYVTKVVSKENRGKVEGVLSVLPLFAMLIIFVGLNNLTQLETPRWDLFFYIIGGVVFLVGILSIFLLPKEPKEERKKGYFSQVLEGFKLKTIKNNKKLYIVLIAYLIYCVATQVFFPYLMVYFEHNLEFSGINFSIVLGCVLILGSILSILFGFLSDRHNKLIMLIPLSLIYMAGLLLVYFVNPGNLAFAIIAGTIMMFGYISMTSLLNSIVRDNIPKGEEGSFMGIRMIFVVMLPMVTGPFIGEALSENFSDKFYTDLGQTKPLPSAYIWLVALAIIVLIFIPLTYLIYKDKKDKKNKNLGILIKGNKHNEEVPLSEYPRPSFVRDSYLCLNGEWDIVINKSNDLNVKYDKKCIVPYAIESPLSGVSHLLEVDEYIHYRKLVKLPEKFKKERLVLHFDGIDQISKIYINSIHISTHIGGYTPIVLDITPFIKTNEFVLEVICKDETNRSSLTRGKQKLSRGGVWYTSSSGIYKPVWLESTSDEFVIESKFTPLINENSLKVFIKTNKDGIAHLKFDRYEFDVETNKEVVLKDLSLPLWEIDDPKLIDVEIRFNKDIVNTYFGYRDIKIEGSNLYLNNKKIFINGLLDQGYYKEGNLTPKSYEDYLFDINKVKELGFNTLRVHIKEECDAFYYYCDANGLLVIQDIPNGGSDYKFWTITKGGVFPFLKKENDKDYKKFSREETESKNEYKEVLNSIINRLYNHPSIIMYTLFNEGWGQFDSYEIYLMAKEIDDSRIYDVASGWYDNGFNEIRSIHSYFYPLKISKTLQKPVIFTEFGGYSYTIKDHFFGLKKFGYRIYNKKEKYEQAYTKLYMKKILPLIKKGLSGVIYTELNDIEDETNGIFTYDRILKINEDVIKHINSKIDETFNS